MLGLCTHSPVSIAPWCCLQLRAMARPSRSVELVMEGVCAALGVPPVLKVCAVLVTPGGFSRGAFAPRDPPSPPLTPTTITTHTGPPKNTRLPHAPPPIILYVRCIVFPLPLTVG